MVTLEACGLGWHGVRVVRDDVVTIIWPLGSLHLLSDRFEAC